MKVAILGGGGFLGRKLAERLAADGTLLGLPISELHLADLSEPAAPEAGFPIHRHAADLSVATAAEQAIPHDTRVVFHLAAVVSGHAEADFDAGMSANLKGTMNVLERCRHLDLPPRLVFTSSVAVYGGEIPQPIEDWYLLNPQTSYGTQKALGELLLNDYARRGFVDGRGLRLPTVVVRKGKPNKAASSFASSIFREPLQGEEAVCPVRPESPMWIASPRIIVENLVKAAELEGRAFGQNRCLALPGLLLTVGEMVEALRRVAGEEVVARIRWQPDTLIQKIVDGWPADIHAAKAERLGFLKDRSFEDNLRYFIEDDCQPVAG